MTKIRYMVFVLALILAAGAVDNMMDSPIAAVIACGALVTLAFITHLERSET